MRHAVFGWEIDKVGWIGDWGGGPFWTNVLTGCYLHIPSLLSRFVRKILSELNIRNGYGTKDYERQRTFTLTS